MPLSFIIKMGVGLIFLAIYLHPSTLNDVPSDTMRFLGESKTLHNIFYKSPTDYFRLLFGIGDDTELISKYLSETFLWDSGSLTIVNDSRNIIRMHSVIHFFSFGSPFIHTLLMCFIGLSGIRHIYLSFEKYIIVNPIIAFFLLLLFPSAMFWTSGILKEPILIFGVGLLLRCMLTFDSIKKRIVLGFISILILISIKPYVLFCLIPAVLFYLIYTYIFKNRVIISLLALVASIGLGMLIFHSKTQKIVNFVSMKQFDFTHIGKGGLYIYDSNDNVYFFKRKDFKNIYINHKKQTVTLLHSSKCLAISPLDRTSSHETTLKTIRKTWPIKYYIGGAQSYIETTPINNSPVQLIKNIPEALINAYARPFPGDPGSTLRFPAMTEVWGLSIFLIFCFLFRRSIDTKTMGIIASLLIFAFSLLVVVGWTTPVIGAIFRYRFPAFLALVIVGIIIIQFPKTKNTDG